MNQRRSHLHFNPSRPTAPHFGRVLLLVVWASSATAQPLSLEEAERRALTTNPSLRQARLEVVAAEERTLQAYSRHLGEGDVVVLANHFEGARLVRPITGPLAPATIASLPFDADQLHAGLTWQIPLFVGGALVEADRAANLLEDAARAQGAHSEAELRYNVRATFRNALTLTHALAGADSLERALEQAEASARLRQEAEASTAVDTLKVRFALASARARRTSLGAQQRTALGLLAALIGDEAELELVDTAVPSSVDDAPAAPAAPEELERSDLRSLRAIAGAQEHRLAAVRAGFWPQLALAGNVFFNAGLTSSPSAPTLEVSLLLKVPVLASIGRIAALREAEANLEIVRERARARALDMHTQVLDAQGRVEAARAALTSSEAQRTLGAEVARVEKLKFESGTGKIEDYLLALSQQFDAETAAWQAQYALQTAHDYLAFTTGNGGSR